MTTEEAIKNAQRAAWYELEADTYRRCGNDTEAEKLEAKAKALRMEYINHITKGLA